MNRPFALTRPFFCSFLICFTNAFTVLPAYAAKRFCPSAKFNLLQELSRSKHISDQDLMAKLDEPNPLGQQLEIGAKTRPLCRNCWYADVSMQELQLTRQAVESEGLIFTGIRAKLHELPLANQSIARIVLRNSHWQLNSNATMAELRSVLVELKRVLKPQGEIWILSNIREKSQILKLKQQRPGMEHQMGYQKQAPSPEHHLIINYGAKITLAQSLGFKVTSIITDSMVGMRLTQ